MQITHFNQSSIYNKNISQLLRNKCKLTYFLCLLTWLIALFSVSFISSSWPWTLCFQADRARGFGARIYCVGVMDFDHRQVGGKNRTDTVGCSNSRLLFVSVFFVVPHFWTHLDLAGRPVSVQFQSSWKLPPSSWQDADRLRLNLIELNTFCVRDTSWGRLRWL